MGSRLLHKTALVTGATSNIGRAIATAFAARAPTWSSAVGASRGGPRSSTRSVPGAARPTSWRATSTARLGPRPIWRPKRAGCSAGVSTSWSIAPGSSLVRRRPRSAKTPSTGSMPSTSRPPFFLTAAIAPAMAARGGRGHHQSGVVDRPPRNPGRRALQLNQGGDRDPHPGLGRRVRTGRRPGQRHFPWGDPYPRAPRSR